MMYKFRRIDGNWQRRTTRNGEWLTLHIVRIQRQKNQRRPNGRDPTVTYQQAYSKWTWR